MKSKKIFSVIFIWLLIVAMVTIVGIIIQNRWDEKKDIQEKISNQNKDVLNVEEETIIDNPDDESQEDAVLEEIDNLMNDILEEGVPENIDEDTKSE